jgi:hypothetical protein
MNSCLGVRNEEKQCCHCCFAPEDGESLGNEIRGAVHQHSSAANASFQTGDLYKMSLAEWLRESLLEGSITKHWHKMYAKSSALGLWAVLDKGWKSCEVQHNFLTTLERKSHVFFALLNLSSSIILRL